MIEIQARPTSASALLYAGQLVPPGVYRRVDLDHEVVLEEAGILPPSFDERLAAYRNVEAHWLVPPKRQMDC